MQHTSLQCFAQNTADACIKFTARLKCLNVMQSFGGGSFIRCPSEILAGVNAILYVIKMQS